MTDQNACPRCQVPLAVDAPGGICPQCLMAQGLETTAELCQKRDLILWRAQQKPGKNLVPGEDQTPFLTEPSYGAWHARRLESGESFGPYQIGPLLGSGGMGAVYAAIHVESGRRVALKVLSHRLESAQHRQRFLREGRLAAAVNHPHSVYVFGTDEIKGAPVIAMELAGGGTLQDRVKREGPLPIAEAVDVVLQIIDGLEAAESAGVLHRDVKPSNCFVNADGSVKIGDFGLSISTTSRAETNLTRSGIFLGTPAYSSPEQLRGDELDVRSDIYSLGVTFFYLLTGRTPFFAEQMVHLLATVLERPAPSPAEFRSQVPAGLAKIVQRCLAKQPRHRFSSYDELRQGLLPHASAAPTPATLGLRVVAYGIDVVLIAGISALIPLLWARDWATWHWHFQAIFTAEPSSDTVLMLLGALGLLLGVGYFTLWESIRGATVGKFICRLRVMGEDREPPCLPRALTRASIFSMALLLPWWIFYAVDAATGTNTYGADGSWLLIASTVAVFSLFLTVRRRNGFAGLHELASGTRVVRAVLHQRRPVLAMPDEPLPESLPETRGEQTIGPYHVLGRLESNSSHSLELGYDPRLLRRVWIRQAAAETDPVSACVRAVSRGGRLRWLSGQRGAEGSWDAYEAPSGKPLLQVLSKPQPWEAVRFWLLDLAEELNAGLADGSAPAALELNRVWITTDGRAKLLDFCAPGLDATNLDSEASKPTDIDSAAASIFLKRVAIAALQGSQVSVQEAVSHDLAVPIPVSARDLLNDLGQSAEKPIPVAQLQSFTQKAAAVSGAKRIGVLAACFIGPLLIAAISTMFHYSEARELRAYPEVGVLAGYLGFYHTLDEGDPRRMPLELIIANRFRDVVTDPEVWSNAVLGDLLISADDRQLVENLTAWHANPTDEQLAAAEEQLAPFRWQLSVWGESAATLHSVPLAVFFLATFSALIILFVVIPSFLVNLFMGSSLLLRSLDIAIVTKGGAAASRLRVLYRNILLWSIILLALAALVATAASGGRTLVPSLLICWIVAMLVAGRGLHDRLAGTRLVPR